MANNFEKLLGKTLKKQAGTVDVGSLVGNDVVGLYFSAHWCPPCRGFTPVLATQYKKMKEEGKKFEVVFVSSDRDQASFDGYYGEMPWLALPFEDRKLKAKLSSKYGVQGIPTLVLLNGKTAEIITKDGRTKVTKEPEAFPWPQPTLADLLGDSFVSHNGPVGKEAIAGKYLALYFSASWCPPCRGFTPKLVECYNKIKERRQDVEVIFVSGDNDEQSFKDYYHKMPWLAFPFEKQTQSQKLNEYFEVEGIPTLVVVDQHGNTITSTARSAVSADPEGKEFPWLPKAVNNVDNPEGINDNTSLVILAEGENAATQENLQKTLSNVAESYLQQIKAAGEDPEVLFFIGTNAQGLSGRLRQMTGVGEATLEGGDGGGEKEVVCDGDVCHIVQKGGGGAVINTKVVLLDIPDNGGFYVMEGGEVNENTINDFLDKYRAGSLTRKQLSK